MRVFVYGTLTDRVRVDEILDEWVVEAPATLHGLRRVEGRYPTLVPPEVEAADATATARETPTVAGRLLRTPEIGALDAYEGVDSGLYVRVRVPVADGGEPAAVYVGDPGRLGVDAGSGAVVADWPGDGPLADRVRRHVADREVVVRPG